MIIRPSNRGVGRFLNGPPKLEYLWSGRLVRSLEDFLYEDPDGKVWKFRQGCVSDGASEPDWSWSILGCGPLNGPHVFGAFLHDDGYRFAERTFEETNMMLWDAMLCGGTNEELAAVIAESVIEKGMPSWLDNAKKRAACGDLSVPANLHRLLEWGDPFNHPPQV